MQEPNKFCSACGQQNHISAAICHWCRAPFKAPPNVELKNNPQICLACGGPKNIGGEVCERCQARLIDGEIRAFYKEKPQYRQEVVVVDFNMSFGSMIMFMVKWAFASIPAMIIMFIIGMILIAILGGLGGALGALSR